MFIYELTSKPEAQVYEQKYRKTVEETAHKRVAKVCRVQGRVMAKIRLNFELLWPFSK
jgi:hypothetical protein